MKKGTFERSRFKDIITHDTFEIFDQRLVRSQKQPYPLTAKAFFASSKGANLLSKLILWWIRDDGHYCYRNNNTGVPRRMRDGSVKWTPGSKFASGAGDIFATINGRSCFFEVKVGKDRMSASQMSFKAGIERSGGFYAISHTFDEFLEQYQSILHK